ncbi:MAG: hypothetical protein NXY59_05735 [Aigarchaeota archaeon]|nr:hypothetical protein [Candidatus Pelearchaeum maunauluense]
MLKLIKALLVRISRFLKYSGKDVIARRYFVLSVFDGTLAAFGIVVGANFVRGTSPATIVAAGIGAAVAMLISGVTGSFMTETAESKKRLKEIEEAMLADMDESIVAEAGSYGAIIAALINGLAQFAAATTVLLPYIISLFYPTIVGIALYASFAIALAMIFTLGTILAKVSRQNILDMSIKMLAVGLLAIMLILLLQFFAG